MNHVPNFVNFEVTDHDLPEYIRVRDNGEAAVTGIIQILDDRAPTWVTSRGRLANLEEDSTDIAIPLEADPGSYGSSVRYSIGLDFSQQGGTLPFGLVMNSDTGVIEGDVPRNLVRMSDPMPFLEEERPVWDTPSQTFTVHSLDEISISLEATPIDEESSTAYYLREGTLPFGVVLKRDGELYGDIAMVLTRGGVEIPEFTPRPRWSTPPGRIARRGEREEFSYQLQATPRLGESIDYFLVNGQLPFGMFLDLKTGLIEGDTAEVFYPELPVVIDRNAPEFVTDVNLGSVDQGDIIAIPIVAQAYNGRSIDRFVLYPDKDYATSLPFGLHLSDDGIVQGTVYEGNVPRTYRFTVVVYDSVGLKSCNVFRLNVLEVEDQSEES